MNKRELQRFTKLVEDEKQRVLQGLGMIEKEINGLSANGGGKGNSSYSNHMADMGTDAMEQEQAFLHASQGTQYLIALEEAHKRIARGNYGVCEECGGTIPAKRLEAYLAARLCVSCKSRLEKLPRN